MTSVPDTTLLHSRKFPVRWSDMDALGHVNNATYLTYFEHTRLEWYDSISSLALGQGKTGTVIVDAHCEYLKPVVYPAVVNVIMSGGVPGRSSFNTLYELYVEGDEDLYTRGSSRVVWIDTQTGKSCPLPDSVVALLPEA